MTPPGPPRRRRAVRMLVVALLLAWCAGCAQDVAAVSWRDLDLQLPDGWVVIQEFDDSMLYVGDGVVAEDGVPGELTVGIQFLAETTPTVAAWRQLVAERDGEIEVDDDVQVDGVPASRLQFTLPGRPDAVPSTREQVLVVPSRHLVILAQAVPVRGSTDGPQLFIDGRDDIDAVLDSIDFGAPLDD